MKKRVFKEILIFCAIALLLSIIVHPDLLYEPFGRLTHMNERGNFFHPLVYTLISYFLILIVRAITVLFQKFFLSKK